MADGPSRSFNERGMSVLTLIERARRRIFHNRLFHEGSHAGVAILLAFILLLLTGTELLDWKWIVLVSAAAVGAWIYRARKHLLTPEGYRDVVEFGMFPEEFRRAELEKMLYRQADPPEVAAQP